MNKKEIEITTSMPVMKKSLLALAVAGTMTLSGGASAVDLGANDVWGDSISAAAGTIADPSAAMDVNLLIYTLTVNDVGDAVALGDVTGTTGSITVTNAADNANVSATIGSVAISGAGNFSQTLTDVNTKDIETSVTGNFSIGGNLVMSNVEPDAAATNALTIGGTATVTGTSAITAGNAGGASTTTLTVTGNSTFTGAMTVTGGANNAGADAIVNLNGATVTATGGIVLDDDTGQAHLNFSGDAIAQTITGAITAAADGEGTITVANSHASGAKFASDIGTSAVRLLAISVTDDDGAEGTALADFNGNTYADTITITAAGPDDAASATFAGNVGFTTLTLNDATTTASVTFDGSSTQTVSGNIQGAADTEGLVVFNNDVNFTGEIGTSATDGVANVRVASGKTLALTSGTDADGLYVTGKLDADSSDTRGGTVSLIAANASAEDAAGTTQVSQIDGTTTLTAVNITGGTGGLSDAAGTDGEAGGASSATFVGASDITTLTLTGGTGGAGLANNATDTEGGVGGATSGTFTAALTATNVNVSAGAGGAGGAGGADAAATGNVGGAGGDSTLDLNVATGTTQAIGTLTITGGTGGDGGATSTNVGGTGGAGGNALATIAGDITGNIVLDSGTAGTSVASGGAGGAGGAGGSATVTFDGGTAQTMTGTIAAAADGEGVIIFSGDSGATTDIVTITGAVGSSSKKIGTITSGVTTAQTNSKFSSDVYATTITHGLDTDWAGDNTITMDFDGDVTFTTLTVTGGSTAADEDAAVTAAGNLTGATIALVEGTAGQTSLTLDGTTAQTISAAITASADKKGAVTVSNTGGAVTFSGAVGVANTSKAIDALTLNASTTTVFESTVAANTLSSSGAVTFKGAVVLDSTLTTADDTTITLGSAFVDGTTAITAADSTSTLDQTANTVTVNLSNQFTTGTVTLLENTADLDATDIASFTVTDTALVDYTLGAHATDASVIDITASKRTTAGIASYLNMSSSQTAALGQITSALASGDAAASTAIDAVLVSGGSSAVNAVEQLNPDTVSANGAALAAVNGANNVISSRQANTRIAFNATGNQSGVSTGDHADDLVVWAQIFGSSATQDKVGTIDGYDADSQGLALGWETDKSGDLMGLSVSYSDADVDGKSASASHTDTTAVQVSAYGTYGKSTDWMIGYASGNNDTRRTINFGGLSRTASGKYDNDVVTAKAGYSFASSETGGWTMTPKVDASYTNIDNDGYTETGAGNLNLVVADSSNDILTARAGAEFTQQAVDGDTVTVSRVDIMAGYDLKNDAVTTTSTFTGGGSSFTTKGADPEKASLQVGFGVEQQSDDSIVSLDFNADLRDGYDSLSGSLMFKSKF